MKATPSQYHQAVQIYETAGQYAVYGFAEEHGITSWSYCQPCEDVTPDCQDNACLVCGSTKTPSEGPFKIQTEAVNGWADLKFSEEDGPYQAELFETLEEALAELEDIQLAFPDCEYRIVPAKHPAEVDIYE
jgi:hypothetical protein